MGQGQEEATKGETDGASSVTVILYTYVKAEAGRE